MTGKVVDDYSALHIYVEYILCCIGQVSSLFPYVFLCFDVPEQNIVVEIKFSLLKYFIGIFQLLTRALLLKQRSRLLFITDDIYNWAYAHRARKRESTVCSRLVPKNCCYLSWCITTSYLFLENKKVKIIKQHYLTVRNHEFPLSLPLLILF